MTSITWYNIHGTYVIGQLWTFLILKDKEYCLSTPYVATKEIIDIFNILKKKRDYHKKDSKT